MNYLLTLLFGCMVISVFAQRKEIVSEDELPNQKYLRLMEVRQTMVYSYKPSSDSSQHLEELDTIYYAAKYQPYTYNKRRFTIDVACTVVACTEKGDTVLTQVINFTDSVVIPIVFKKIRDSYTHVSIYATSVKKKIHGKKSFFFRDKIGEVRLRNTRVIILGIRARRIRTHYSITPVVNWEGVFDTPMKCHGYNLNQTAVKLIPGVY